MKTLDTLAAHGSELTTEQLDNVDGGFVMLVIATLCVIDAGLWGYIAGKASASN